MASPSTEVFVAFRAPPAEARDSRAGANHLALLPEEHHDVVRAMIAGQWVPMRVAEAHYEACQGLDIEPHEVNAIGREVGDRIERTFLATMVRMAGSIGGHAMDGAFVRRSPLRPDVRRRGRRVRLQAGSEGRRVPLRGRPHKPVPEAAPPTGAVLHVAWA